MAGKVFPVFIVAFWAVMTTALVRVEFFPSPVTLRSVPTDQIVRRLFANTEPQHLNVWYQGKHIGHCELVVVPATDAEAYRVDAKLRVRLQVLGVPSWFDLKSVSWYDHAYELTKYNLTTSVGESRVQIEGDNAAKRLAMTFDLGDGPQAKEIDYAELNDPAALQTLGLPGLNGALPTGSAGKLLPLIRAYEDRIEIGGVRQRAYRVDCQSEQNPDLWAKIWIDEQGNILKVDTSLKMTMVAGTIDTIAGRQREPKVISKPRPL